MRQKIKKSYLILDRVKIYLTVVDETRNYDTPPEKIHFLNNFCRLGVGPSRIRKTN
jgi:hypothetical protein